MRNSKLAFFRVRELGVAAVLMLQIALFTMLIGRDDGGQWVFLASKNLTGIVLESAVIGVATVGVTVVIIAGGIDLSVGGLIALSSVVVAGLLRSGQAVPVALGGALLMGALFGGVAAALATWVGLPPFIATLALMLIARGLAYVISKGEDWSIDERAPGFTQTFGESQILGVPYLILVLVFIAALVAFALSKTAWGRQVFAVGGNEVAARYAGVSVHKIKWSVYVLSGILASLAGIIFAAKYGTGRSDTAAGYELDAVAAAVVGGASLSGGRGSIVGAVLGALIFTTLRTGLNQVPGASVYQEMIIGLVVIGAVVIDRLIQKRVAA